MRVVPLTLLVSLVAAAPAAAQVPVPSLPPTPATTAWPVVAAEVALAALEPTLEVVPRAASAVALARVEALAASAASLAGGVPPQALDAAVPYALAAVPQALAAAVPNPLAAVPQAIAAAALSVELSRAASLPALSTAVPLLSDLPGLPILGAESGDDFADFAVDAPEPWAPQDPADSLYRAARVALNAGDFARAAELFSRIHTDARFRGSEYRAIAYYYDALSRSRVGGRAELQRARAALDAMRTQHASAWRNQRDAAALLTRIDADLARLGDAAAAREVQVRAQAVTRDPCTDANSAVKVEAISALMQMDAARAMPILEEVLKNKGTDACSAELRRRAIFIISQQRSDRSSAILLDAARNDPDPQVRKQAVFFLGQVGGDQALAALQSILASSDNADVRQQALFAISQHPSPRAGELLRDFVLRSDVSSELRGQALFFLGQRGNTGEENAQFLRELYPRLTDPEVRQKALFAISQTPGQANADWLIARALDQNENLDVRKQALFLASQQRAVPVARLAELYDRVSDRELKAHIAFVLSQHASDPQAVDLLMKIARDDQNPELRKQAIFWLGQSKDPRAAEFLLELIRK